MHFADREFPLCENLEHGLTDNAGRTNDSNVDHI
jgi:hypothetical protein